MSRTKTKDVVVQLGVLLPKRMFIDFKICTIDQRKTMSRVVRELITKYIKTHSDKEKNDEHSEDDGKSDNT